MQRLPFVWLLTLGCAERAPEPPKPSCSSGCELACATGPAHCPDLAPLAELHFQIGPPSDDADYPYGPTRAPSTAPAPGSDVFLSSQGSGDPEGASVRTFWNAQDPSGNYLELEPQPDAVRASFRAARAGTYTITLQVTELSEQRQTTQTRAQLLVAPRPCAADGASAPCDDQLLVNGGTFLMGSPDSAGFESEYPQHPVTVDSFWLDEYEVTVGRFRRFVETFEPSSLSLGAGAHPKLPESGWRDAWLPTLPETPAEFDFAIAECGGTWTATPEANEARPISCITWFEAFAFCAAEGKRLPTEAEWEYAASGGDQQRIYPWGDEAPSPERAVFACVFDSDSTCTDADLPVAGSLATGAGRFGQLDLAGSLWEWTLDAYAPYTSEACDNCALLGAANEPRVFRGGDYKFDDAASLRASTRYAFLPAFPDPTRGFRCARSAEP
ncbi:MAG TPA: SUMF1/EgtB/PvdO family nonheme iron enzyme [Polyangiaceae bacterium]|nr:SUMF1/EgtB/PvdO family nonheme iron enzyme [Polyangiaceae bacterium]